jgi:dynein intermediate chain 2
LTNAVWGHARTTVVYTANIQGTVDAWDLIQSLRDPICSISVGHCPVYSMAAEPSGQFLLTGDADGTATLLELNDPLRTISQQERSLFNGMMGREAKRAKNYDQFLKEQKMRDKAKAVGGEDDGAKKEVKVFDPSALESEFEAALRGEAERVQEKKRVVIGGDEESHQESVSGGDEPPGVDDDVTEDVLNPGEPAVAREAPPEAEPEEGDGQPQPPEPEPAAAPEPKQEEEERREPTGEGGEAEPQPTGEGEGEPGAAEPEPEPEPANEGDGAAEPTNDGDGGAEPETGNEGGGEAEEVAEQEPTNEEAESEQEPPSQEVGESEAEPESEAAVEEVEAEQPPNDSEVDVEEPPAEEEGKLPDIIGGTLQ